MKKRVMLILSCLFISIGFILAQTTKISGTVVDNNGESVIGASVVVKGTTIGVATDLDGKFSIEVPDGKNLLVFSLVGMKTVELNAAQGMRVVMTDNETALSEVVVVAYGTAKREALTGSVSVLDSKKIEKRITTNAMSALEGSAPGIMVNSTYGEPGASPSIRIRGQNTLSSVAGSKDPLYVVDGTPFDGNLSSINPSDIESISVLKDASSAALYGNRAANGVIIITTKKGKVSGKTAITVDINQGIYNRGIKEYDRLGADKWMEAEWTGMKNYAMSLASLSLDEASAAEYATKNLIQDLIRRNIYDAPDNALFDSNGKLIANRLSGYSDLDWQDKVERNGHRQEYTVSAASSGEKYNVYASVGYTKENGYIITTDFERFTGRINTIFTPNKWFKTGINVTASSQEQNYNSSAYGTYYANPFYATRMMAPVYPIYLHNEDGSYLLDENGKKQYDLKSDYLTNRHIVYELNNDKERNRRNSLAGQAFATFNLPFNIDFTVKGDLNYRTTNRNKYGNPNIGDGAANGGRMQNYAYQYTTSNLQQLISWGHDWDKHHVDLLAGHESYSYYMELAYGMNTNMSVEGNETLGNFPTNSYYTGYKDEYKTESYLSRLRYNYDEKYFLDLSFRRDGSSRFYKDNRWGNFYSIGASWNIIREDFMKDIDWVNHLRLRASYGEVGNDAPVSYYAHMALYSLDKNGGNGALVKKSLPAKGIKWETSQTVDLAIEGRILDRLNFSAGYFNKRSKDLLFQVKLPLSTGSYPFDSGNTNMPQYQNIGTISNKGFELAADIDIIRTKDWTWNFGIDATILKSKIIKLPNGDDILNEPYHKFTEGRSLYSFWLYKFAGVDQMTGNSLYILDPKKREDAIKNKELVEINGTEYTLQTTYAKKDWSGKAEPDVYGSFNSTLSWKNVSLNALFTYQIGGKYYDGAYRNLMSTGATSASALHTDVLKSWSGIPEGMTDDSPNRIKKNGIPRIDHNRSQYNNSASDRWLTNASYLAFKNINISYNFPKKTLSSLGIDGLILKAGVENLFTLTKRQGLNPQATFSGAGESGEDNTYVTARVYNIGLSLKF